MGLRNFDAFEQPMVVFGIVDAIFSIKFARLQAEIESLLLLFSNLIAALGEFPHHASAVLALRNGAFKIHIRQWMILDTDRQAHNAGPGRQAFGDGPGPQNPVSFQPQIIVQPGGVMPVNDKGVSGSADAFRLSSRWGAGRRLGSFVEGSLARVRFELFWGLVRPRRLE